METLAKLILGIIGGIIGYIKKRRARKIAKVHNHAKRLWIEHAAMRQRQQALPALPINTKSLNLDPQKRILIYKKKSWEKIKTVPYENLTSGKLFNQYLFLRFEHKGLMPFDFIELNLEKTNFQAYIPPLAQLLQENIKFEYDIK